MIGFLKRRPNVDELARWIINNLLTESQLDVIPPGFSSPLRSISTEVNKRGYIEGRCDGYAEALKGVEQRRRQFREIDLNGHVNAPVIAVGNEWEDPVIGFGVRVEFITKSQEPMLVVYDYVTGREVMPFGVIRTYTHQLYRVVRDLNPYERWALMSNNSDSYQDYDKPKSGVASSPSELGKKLIESGFFDRVNQFLATVSKDDSVNNETGSEDEE